MKITVHISDNFSMWLIITFGNVTMKEFVWFFCANFTFVMQFLKWRGHLIVSTFEGLWIEHTLFLFPGFRHTSCGIHVIQQWYKQILRAILWYRHADWELNRSVPISLFVNEITMLVDLSKVNALRTGVIYVETVHVYIQKIVFIIDENVQNFSCWSI